MQGELSLMDWIALSGWLTAVAGVLGVAVALLNVFRDNKALSKDHESLSEGHKSLSNEHQSIKEDTKYISDEMKLEKMARKSLYKNSSRAKEILETMDMMKEVVLQNAQLNVEVSKLKVQNQELLQKETDADQLFAVIRRFERTLSGFEEYGETEEIRALLKQIRETVSEFAE